MMSDHEIFDKYDLVDVDESFPIPSLPEMGLIFLYGPSGSGKSTILTESFDATTIQFGEDPIWMEFSTPERAEELLTACGLRSIPTWKRPYSQLSNGEQHRAYCAKAIDMGCEYIDEFTSVVDRDTAKSLAFAISKFFKKSGMKRLVIASCHSDILDWITPDHAYDTGSKSWVPRECLRQTRPDITIKLEPCNGKSVWEVFRKHHYLSHSFNNSSNAWVVLYNGKPIAFTAIIAFPSGSLKKAWRGHRTVVIPEFQGLGIGNAVSNAIGDYLISNGYRYFSKTAHPAMGEHREKSSLWKPTSKNKKKRLDYKGTVRQKDSKDKMRHKNRLCYSHEYIGE
jgi:energy-coupling factor transporter ATP-binding protein EcfA2